MGVDRQTDSKDSQEIEDENSEERGFDGARDCLLWVNSLSSSDCNELDPAK